MKQIILPARVEGTLKASPSKSHTQRVYAAALLHKGNTFINGAGESKDEMAALNIIRSLGAEVIVEKNVIEVSSDFFNHSFQGNHIIDCGESGLSIRIFAPVIALLHHHFTLTGKGSLASRPMNFFDAYFPKLNVKVKTEEGLLPINIEGPLLPCNITVDGSVSSQFLTGLLYAFGETVQQETVITVNALKSKPYIDLTLQVLKNFGYRIRHEGYERFYISPKEKIAEDIHCFIEGDRSNAAFLLVAGAVAGSVKLTGLNADSLQPDHAIIEVLKQCGAAVEFTDDAITVNKSALHAFSFDATDCPDLFPPLVALAVYCKGKSIIKGVHRLFNKESNRAASLKEVFEKMGAAVVIENDSMIIEAANGLKHATVSSHGDHRIAMASAVAGIGAEGVTIEGADAVEKSYPSFFKDLRSLSVKDRN